MSIIQLTRLTLPINDMKLHEHDIKFIEKINKNKTIMP